MTVSSGLQTCWLVCVLLLPSSDRTALCLPVCGWVLHRSVWNQSNETVSSLAVSVSLHHSIWKLSNGCNIIPWVGCIKPAASLWFGLLVYFRCNCVSVSVESGVYGTGLVGLFPWKILDCVWKGCSRAPSLSARHLSLWCRWWLLLVVDYYFYSVAASGLCYLRCSCVNPSTIVCCFVDLFLHIWIYAETWYPKGL